MKLIILLFFLSLTATCKAQSTNRRHTVFGVKPGITYTAMNFNKGVPPPSQPIALRWKIGISINALLNIQLTERLSLQSEYGFLTASSARADSGALYYFSYFSFPVFLKFKLVKGLHFMGGAQFDLLFTAKGKKAERSNNITHDTEERNIGITGGLEYFFTENLSFSARYTQGLNHIGIGQRSNVQEYKSQQAILAAGFYF